MTSSAQASTLRLYLAAFKLIEMILVLPSEKLPQFQMQVALLHSKPSFATQKLGLNSCFRYKWAFISDGSVEPVASDVMADTTARGDRTVPSRPFVPHLVRIHRLLTEKVGSVSVWCLFVFRGWWLEWSPNCSW